MRLIDGEELYKRACDLEHQALSYLVDLRNEGARLEEIMVWSTILTERTAFKNDIYDALLRQGGYK